jgi:hypothetical protein
VPFLAPGANSRLPWLVSDAVDAETQMNHLDIVRALVKVKKDVPIERVYDFSFAEEADQELNPIDLASVTLAAC